MKLKFLLIYIFLSFFGFSQNPNEVIDSKNLNVKYLEYLIKNEIDHVRLDLGIPKLVNDSILYLASKDHTEFLNRKHILSHYEESNTKKYTPQNRADFFGAKNYQVGENLVQIPLNTVIKVNDDYINTNTYIKAAEAMRLL